jgi:hypothetical protein
MANVGDINKLIESRPKTSEEAIGLLNRFNGGVSDIYKESQFGKALDDLGINVKDYGSVKDLTIALKTKIKNQKKIVQNQIDQDKKGKEETNKKNNKEKEKVAEKEKIKEEKEKARKNEIQRKIEIEKEKVAEKITKDLGGDEKLKKVVKDEVEKIIRNKEIRTEKEKKNDLVKEMSKVSGKTPDTGMEVAAQEIVKATKNFELENINTVRQYRKDSLKEEIERGYLISNSNLT